MHSLKSSSFISAYEARRLVREPSCFRYLIQYKSFTQICHLWPPRTFCMAKFQTSEIFLPNARFYSNLSLLPTTDKLCGTILQIIAKFLLKFIIFDHHGHVACQNFIFFKYFCFMQNFTQICHF